MRTLARARVDEITEQGVWALAADYGRVGPLDCIGIPTVGAAALLVQLPGTAGDMVLLCGVEALKAAVAQAGTWEEFKTIVEQW